MFCAVNECFVVVGWCCEAVRVMLCERGGEGGKVVRMGGKLEMVTRASDKAVA